ncbi:WXG100 family type VII secretion target [Glycomyces arizonensis]|uniref:WXG100 family type VII secretion target n=1 Tax=Glycomyces arizonensis TaxID=256035 RepID=UPI00041012F3|nr:hypothetical protein [Glycomyces arizonensis]
MANGKGFDYYRNNYTHTQLWEMLITQGDPWSVEQAGSVWSTAKGGLESARDQLDASMLETVDYWQGPASEEFQRRMRLVYEYSKTTEEEMMDAAENTVPQMAQDLRDAQGKAQDQDLSPASELEYEDWLEEIKNVKPTDPDYLEKQEQYRNEYEQYKSDRHDSMAHIVADLGDLYATHTNRIDKPPAAPPSDMPGNSTYQPPTGGVFGNDGLNQAGANPMAPGSDPNSTTTDLNGDGIPDDSQDDLDPVDPWEPGSYGDLDSDVSGGLAHGTIPTIAGGGGYTPSTVGGGGMGGSLTGGTGAGLFGPAKGSGAGSAPGRGTGAGNSPARNGATKSSGSSSTRSGSGSGRGSGGGRGMGSNSSGRGMNRGMGPRGGTRSGYNDDDEEEEYTRETWLREDDMNWSRNRTPDDEVDD